MNKLLPVYFIALLFGPITVYGQPSVPKRYTSANYFEDTNIKVHDSIVYGKAKDWERNKVTLDMTIAYPKLSIDSIKKRPLILLIHGGSFVSNSKEQLHDIAIMLAKRGFVAASINYRLGKKYSSRQIKKWDSSVYMDLYRAVQDSKAALRFLSHNAARYGIDTSWIFVQGASAGAITAIYLAYYKQANWDRELPWLRKKLGRVDYSSNTLKNKYTIKGVIDMWGGIHDTANISMEDVQHIAILIFHGTKDSIVPYIKSGRPDYHEAVSIQGAYLITQRYKHLGGYYQLNTKIDGRHGEDFSCNFIAAKTGTFCKSVFSATCKSGEFSTILRETLPSFILVFRTSLIIATTSAYLFSHNFDNVTYDK